MRLNKTIITITLTVVLLLTAINSPDSFSRSFLEKNQVGSDFGIENYHIKQIVQGPDGVLWIATFSGLLKFDGYEFSSYKNKLNDTNSISINSIHAIVLDDDGILWLGTTRGLNRFDYKSGAITQYLSDTTAPDSINSSLIFSTIEHDASNLWVGTDKGVDLFNKKTGMAKTIYSFEDLGSSTVRRDVHALALSSDSSILLIGSAVGLVKYDLKENKGLYVNKAQDHDIFVKRIVQRSKTEFLVGTDKGLYTFNTRNNSLSIVDGPLVNESISGIEQDNANNFWISSSYGGVYILNNSNEFETFQKNYDQLSSASTGPITNLFFDSNNYLWIGAKDRGLFAIDPMIEQFNFIPSDSGLFSCISSNNSVYAEKHKTDKYWIASGFKLALVSLQDSKCNSIPLSPVFETNKTVLYISKLHEDPREDLWIGTTLGLYFKNRSKDYIESIPIIQNKIVFDIFTSSNGTTYFSTSEGIYSYSPESRTFRKIKSESSHESIAYKTIQRSASELLAATWEGIYVIDEGVLKKDTRIPVEYQNRSVRGITVDSNNRTWIAFDGAALVAFDEHMKVLYTADDQNRLHTISRSYEIIEDATGIMWIIGKDGIASIDPSNDVIRSFHDTDGLQSNAFSPNSILSHDKSKIFASGSNGVNYFNPTEIKIDQSPPKVNITKFLHFNTEIKPGDTFGSRVLKENVSVTKNLTLDYSDYIIGFEFSAFHFGDPKRNQFAYQLEGYDKDWNHTDYKYRRASYTNLPAGDYIFKVKAASKHGIWSEPKSLNITILPPFWLTPLAYTIYALLIIISIYSVIVVRTRVLTKRSKELAQQVKQRTSEVEQLLAQKNDEFANVSHEFRTPLTLILGPTSQLLRESSSPESNQRLNVIQRNGYRLLRMVDQLLNIETFRVKAITQKSPQAFGETIKLVAEAFADIAAEKNIQFEIGQIDSIYFEFTPDALEKILLNLLSNALKYTQAGGTIKVKAVQTKDGQYLISVSDTGVGIAKDDQPKIFERFKRILNENSEQVTGAGIGLALVKSLVEVHQGRIELSSELGQGTTIEVYLPVVNEVDKAQVKGHNSDEIIAMEIMSISSQGQPNKETALDEQRSSDSAASVLIVEDNQDMRQYIAESIQLYYQVFTANNGKEGLAVAIDQVPDLIISDIMMPKMDGYELTHALRDNEITNHIPIVLLTARGDKESRLKGWQEKADEYLTKPFDVDELRIRLNNLLEIRNILKRRFGDQAFNLSKETIASSSNTLEQMLSEQQNRFIEKLNAVIDKIYSDSTLSIVSIAAAIGMSERQISRKLKSILDMTPSEYLRRYRLEKARELLDQGHKANYVTYETGFSSQSYFSRCFKAQYGVSPGEYRSSSAP